MRPYAMKFIGIANYIERFQDHYLYVRVAGSRLSDDDFFGRAAGNSTGSVRSRFCGRSCKVQAVPVHHPSRFERDNQICYYDHNDSGDEAFHPALYHDTGRPEKFHQNSGILYLLRGLPARKIVVPISKTVYATVFILDFVAH